MARIQLPSDSLLAGGFNEVYTLSYKDFKDKAVLTSAFPLGAPENAVIFHAVLFVDKAFDTATEVKVTFGKAPTYNDIIASGLGTGTVSALVVKGTGAVSLASRTIAVRNQADNGDASVSPPPVVFSSNTAQLGFRVTSDVNLNTITTGSLRVLLRIAYKGDLFNDPTPIQN